MNLAFLDRDRGRHDYTESMAETHGHALRVAIPADSESGPRSWEPRIIRGGEGVVQERATCGPVTARAEIHAKRFFGNRVDEDRYSATVAATDGSPNALLAALSRAFAEVDEFRASRGPGERVILQVSLIL